MTIDPIDCDLRDRGACDVTVADLVGTPVIGRVQDLRLNAYAAEARGDQTTCDRLLSNAKALLVDALDDLRAKRRSNTIPSTDKKATTDSMCTCGKNHDDKIDEDPEAKARRKMILDGATAWASPDKRKAARKAAKADRAHREASAASRSTTTTTTDRDAGDRESEARATMHRDYADAWRADDAKVTSGGTIDPSTLGPGGEGDFEIVITGGSAYKRPRSAQ